MAVEITDPAQLRAALVDWLPKLFAANGRTVTGLTVSPLSKPRTGQSNETVLFNASWQEAGRSRETGLVLRRQPRANQMFLDADVVREGRLIQRLGQVSPIAVPAIYAIEPDPEPLGAPFFLMARIEGHVPAGTPSVHRDPWLQALTPRQRTRLLRNAITSLAGVHNVPVTQVRTILDPQGTGGTLDADVENLQRWYDWARRDRSFPILDRALRTIRDGLGYEPDQTVLLWGDPRPGNMIFSEDLDVAAVLDWELAAIGPAGLDVGWWLMMDEFARRAAGGDTLAGFPTEDDVVAAYQADTGWVIDDLDFYRLVAAVKLAITLIPAADSLVARAILPEQTRFAHDNVPTQVVARLLGIAEPGLSPDYRRLSRMDRARQP
ncbi:MAG TPA: phosphotransferase family protein [Amycolatopsis sp.]|nr:phosphotransferase family protein [Amycolatopsis sp.]